MSAPVSAQRSHTKAYIVGSVLSVLMIVGLYLLVRNITDTGSHPLNTLKPRGSESDQIHHLAVKVFAVAGIVFVLVQAAVLFLIFRFRRHKNDVDGEDEPVQIHGKSSLEWTWTAVPAALLMVLAVFNVQTLWDLQNNAENADMKIGVIGQ